ncbi:MAG: hypothetical protein KF690_11910 [Bacteroidetes bacterium]|nr:hypothetical protein [Bacteroidota bacterium]
MFSFLKRILHKSRPVSREHPFRTLLDPGHEVVHAFDFEGVRYWKFSNEYNLPFERMQAAVGILEELDMGVDREYLQASMAAVKTHLEQGKLGEAWKWVHELEERLSWPVDADRVYRLAAVVFMQADENPYAYDPALARRKIERWSTRDRDAELLRSFFLSLGLASYLGPLTDAGIVLPDFMQAQRQVKLRQLSALCTLLYAQAKTADWYSSMRQEATDLKTLLP